MPLLVNGQLVEDQLVRKEASLLKERLKTEVSEADGLSLELRAREWARENIIQRILLQQAALQDPEGLPAKVIDEAVERSRQQSPQDDEGLRARIELDLRIDQLLDKVSAQVPRPKPKEVVQYYQQFKSSFRTPEQIHAAHIVKNVDETIPEEQAEQAIREAAAELKSGGDFAEIAGRRSDCPGRGGDLGFFSRGDMVEEFEAVVFAMRPNQVSEVFRTPFGFHIAKVIARRPAGTSDLSQVRDGIEAMLWNQRKREATMEFLNELRAKAEIRKVAG